MLGASFHSRSTLLAVAATALLAAACGDTTNPVIVSLGDGFAFSNAQINALDSSARVVVAANPSNGTLKSLVDSTLLVLQAGVQAKRLDVTTNLSTAPLYFVGVHRVVTHATGSFSTWTLVGMDNPSQLANLVEVSGFAPSANNTAPTSVSGTIGDGTGVVNALFIAVGAGGSLTQWSANTGTVSFSSDAPSGPCPVAVTTPNITCTLETMHVHFSASAASGSGGAGARQASVVTDVAVPAIRLTFTG
jgi:hypothetical protein